MFMYLLCIYKKPIILSLFKIDILNFTMYILTILICSLKIYVIRLHNLNSINIFFTMKDHRLTNRLKKPFKNSDFFKFNFNEHFSTRKCDSFPL